MEQKIKNRLKELRIEKDLTQEALAKELGVSLRTIQKWENSESNIRTNNAHKIAKYFGVSVGYLLGYINYNDRDLSSPELWEEYGKNGEMDLGYGIAVLAVGKDTLDKVVATLRELCDYNQEDFFKNGEGKDYNDEGKKEYLEYHHMFVDEKIADLIRVLVSIPDGNHLRDILFSYLTLEKQSRVILDKIILNVFSDFHPPKNL